MAIIRPRLIDFYNIPTTQEEVDFAIPFLDEDKRELIEENLAGLSECSEVGLGSGKTKKGLKISINTAKEILDLFSIVPQYKTGGFSHFEEIQLYVNIILIIQKTDISGGYNHS